MPAQSPSLRLSFLLLVFLAGPYGFAKTGKIVEKKILPLIGDFQLSASTTPVIVYYVIDTPEPLMQVSVDFELRGFYAHCNVYGKQNWVAFVNSYILVNQGEIVYCKDGVRKTVFLQKQAPELYAKMTTKIGLLATDTSPALLPLEFPVTLTEENEKHRHLYGKYPLANADIMYHLLAWLEDDALFPNREFTKFIHYKAHAVRADADQLNILLTGLDDHVLKEKTNDQVRRWSVLSGLAPSDESSGFIYGTAGKKIGGLLPNSWLQELGVGRVDTAKNYSAYMQPEMDTDVEQGLGRRYGLGAASFFGIDARLFTNVIHKLVEANVAPAVTHPRRKEVIGFMLIEACHANITSYAGTELVLASYSIRSKGIYSPVGALWYRNINWTDVFESGDYADNDRLYQTLFDRTSQIVNYLPEVKTKQ